MLRRGFFRLWIVATVLWDGFWLLSLYGDTSRFLDVLPLLITPPLVVLAIGWMIAWALRGFARE